MRAFEAGLLAFALGALACSSDDEGPVDTRTCGSLSDSVTPADFVWAPSSVPPEPTGGTLIEGSYYLKQETLHGADPDCGEQVIAIETRSPYSRQALAIAPSSDTTGTLELVTTVHADPVRSSAAYEIVDTGLSFSSICGNASPFPEGTPFTAEGDELWFFTSTTTCAPESLHFVRF
jgi:hypothetical protein